MVKSRMTAVDICAMVHGISKDIKGQKLINIYDINNRTYLFKFGGEGKKFLLVESGIRFHTTYWKRGNECKTSVSNISYFNSKLRRYLRNKKLVEISQMDMDRIVNFTFGFGENIFHLILEFFVAGNIILTDINYNVLVILRETSDLSIGKHYNWKTCEAVLSPNRSFSSSFKSSNAVLDTLPYIREWKNEKFMKEELKRLVHELNQDQLKKNEEKTNSIKKKKYSEKSKTGVTILDILSRILKFFNLQIIEELLKSENIDGNDVFTFESIDIYSELFVKCISKAINALMTLQNNDVKGLLIIHLSSENEMIEGDTIIQESQIETSNEVDFKANKKVYIYYSPYIQEHSWISNYQSIPKNGLVIKRIVSSFCECVDEFYSSIDIEKETKNTVQEHKVINSKIDKVKMDQERRLETLNLEREACIVRAKIMESHQELLEKILQLVRHLIATGAQWQDIWNEIQQQRKNNHPLAKYIKSLELYQDQIKIRFFPEDLISETFLNTDQKKKGIEFDLFISKSIQSNIRYQYDESKQLAKKLEKTKHAYKLALNKVTKAAKKDIEKLSKGLITTAPKIRKLRTQYWFEKFYWFISSDGYLVIGGHDASQNELLFRRYLEKNDRYIHADIHGATTCIVKNPNNVSDIPLNTLSEAGQMSICYSKAWANKTVISAWWVFPDQVSKTAPSGEYLSTGGFVIRGKKNFLPPLKLEMGCALYFIKNKKIDLPQINDIQDDKAILLQMQSTVDDQILVQGADRHDLETDKQNLEIGKQELEVESEESDSGDDADEEEDEKSNGSSKNEEFKQNNHSNSVHVRFSVGDVSDVIPPLKIEHKVQFDELPPELLISKPFNPLSIDETSNQTSSVNSIESLTNLANKVNLNESFSEEISDEINNIDNCGNFRDQDENVHLKIDLKSSNHLHTPVTSSRRSSVDEGPPPTGFSISTLPTPAELLSHKVEFPTNISSSSSEDIVDNNNSTADEIKNAESNSNSQINSQSSSKEETSDWIKSLDASPSQKIFNKNNHIENISSHDEFNNKLRENYRRRSIDGGPTPRGFIPDHVPSARELLQKIRFDPVDLELEHLSHMRERGRFISDAVPYLPEELQRLIMVSNQNSNRKHRFTIDTNSNLLSRVNLKDSVALNLNETFAGNSQYSSKKDNKEINRESSESSNLDTNHLNYRLESESNVVEEVKNKQLNINKLSRRKKSKLKKVAIKYGDQDEDERKAKMMLFGSQEMKTSTSQLDKSKSSTSDLAKPIYIFQQEKKKKEQDRMEKIYKNRIVDNTVENREFQNLKNCLLSTNEDNDSELIAVIPIFAPFSCIKHFKYCVKLTPGGNVKRSKTAQDIIQYFSNNSYKEKEERPNSYEIIRTLKIDDIIKNTIHPARIHIISEKKKNQVDNE